MDIADILTSMVVDVSDLLDNARKRGDLIMFEGAQGTLLDIDHGTYPYVTSSNTTAGGVATGSGIGPRYVDYVLGIIKAYSTRVGAGPFPTELFDDVGEFLCEKATSSAPPPAAVVAPAGWTWLRCAARCRLTPCPASA